MKIFLSHANERKQVAEPIAFALRARGHTVFLDRDDLPPGESFEDQIHAAIDETDLFVFLISPESVANGRFTMTEIAWARKKWGTADSHVLPVMIAPTDLALVPAYLKSVTILEPIGNVAAEVSAVVADLVKPPAVEKLAPKMLGIGALSGLTGGVLAMITPGSLSSDSIFNWAIPGFIIQNIKGAPLYVPALFTAALVFGLARWSNVRVERWLMLLVCVTIGWIAAVNIALKVPDAVGGGHVSLSDDQIAADTEEAREEIKSAIDKSNTRLSRIAMLVSSFIAGAVGATATVYGLFASLGGARRRAEPPVLFLVILIGGVAGMTLVPAVDTVGMFNDTYLPLFVVWQGAMGAALAYAIGKSKA